MPIPSNAFTLHDNKANSTLPKPVVSARATRLSSRTKPVTLTANHSNNMNGTPPAYNWSIAGTSTSSTTSKRRNAGASVDLSEADDEIFSPALQNGQYSNGTKSARSRHKKSKSKLALDIIAANTLANGGDSIKKIDWEIPRKVLHSSIGFLTLSLYTTQSSPWPVIYTLGSALLVIVPADILRLEWPGPGSKYAKLYERLLGFLMRESEKKKYNGVIWYIVGVGFSLLVYPLDIAVVSILILSWADTAASTLGRLYGPSTPPLPPQTPILHLPLAPRKSSAGFLAATVTGALIAVGFYKFIGPVRPQDLSWTFEHGARAVTSSLPDSVVAPFVRDSLGKWGWQGINTGGWVGLGVLGIFAGLVAGVSEALDLGSLDDNLTLPIISGGCIWGFFKIMSFFSS